MQSTEHSKPLCYNASTIKNFSSCQFRHYYKEIVPTSYRRSVQEKEGKTSPRFPSHVGLIFHKVVSVVCKQYTGDFAHPLWSDIERTLEAEWAGYKQAHVSRCLKEKKKVTLRDEQKAIILKLLLEYHEVFWTSPTEKIVAAEIDCSWTNIEKLRKTAQLPRGDREARQAFYRKHSVPFGGVRVALTGGIDLVTKSSDHRRIGVHDHKTVSSCNRKEIERQFETQINSTRYQLGVYATILPAWIDPKIMLEGNLSEASVRLVSPLGVQQRIFNRTEVQQAKEDVKAQISSLIRLKSLHALDPDAWSQKECWACEGCEAITFCRLKNPNAKPLIPAPDWREPNKKKLEAASF